MLPDAEVEQGRLSEGWERGRRGERRSEAAIDSAPGKKKGIEENRAFANSQSEKPRPPFVFPVPLLVQIDLFAMQLLVKSSSRCISSPTRPCSPDAEIVPKAEALKCRDANSGFPERQN